MSTEDIVKLIEYKFNMASFYFLHLANTRVNFKGTPIEVKRDSMNNIAILLSNITIYHNHNIFKIDCKWIKQPKLFNNKKKFNNHSYTHTLNENYIGQTCYLSGVVNTYERENGTHDFGLIHIEKWNNRLCN